MLSKPARTGVLLGLVMVVSVAPAALIIGGWAGLATAIVGATLLWGIYRVATRTPARIPCPKCTSTRTEEIWARGPDASEASVCLCSSCGHQWDAVHVER
jgi:hypothetical protein